MKHTDFWEKEKELKTEAINELAKAIEAHGGKYVWCDEEGEVPEDADLPFCCVFLDSGPIDVKIKSIKHDEKGWWIEGETIDEWCPCDVSVDDLYDISSASQIDNIIDAIPATKEVDDVTITKPRDLRSRIVVDSEDLATRGFNGENLTEEQFEEIGAKMFNYYLDGEFYEDMQEACWVLEIPRIEEETEE